MSSAGDVLMEQKVQKGDIFRMCQTKDAPIKDWVKLAVTRATLTDDPVIFWLDETRAHDKEIVAKVNKYLPDRSKDEHPTTGIQVSIKTPVMAIRESMERAKAGKNTISATGNVLRDYLTDLFPILELGTSAKMLSIVPLLKGGGLYETGAGGSAPKHIQQLVKENHLRWDSLGEFLALAVSIEDLGIKTKSDRAKALAEGLNDAVGQLLVQDKSPKRKCHQLDNRGSHFYIALFWAEAMAKKSGFEAEFGPLATELRSQEEKIMNELNSVQGQPVDLGGYYHVDPVKAQTVMRPSSTFNNLIDSHGMKAY